MMEPSVPYLCPHPFGFSHKIPRGKGRDQKHQIIQKIIQKIKYNGEMKHQLMVFSTTVKNIPK